MTPVRDILWQIRYTQIVKAPEAKKIKNLKGLKKEKVKEDKLYKIV